MIGFRLVAFLISCLLIGSGPALGAQDASFWAFLPEGRVVTRCADGSAPQKEASDKLQQLDERIQELADSAPVANAVGELHELLKTECFLAAAETNRIPNPDTTRSLKEWWLDGYGRDWLESLLVVSKQGSIDHLAPYIGVPPDARKTLNLEAHRTHPLSTLLCATSDATCGRETRGWRVRAEESFEAHRATGQHDGSHIRGGWRAPSFDEVSERCAENPLSGEEGFDEEESDKKASGVKASDADMSQRYQPWRACVERARPKQVALPLGDFKAPQTGWLVIAGRRGHYQFCDTVRAYHLGTGAAFIDDSCSALELLSDGQVDGAATNKGRTRRVTAGVVPAQNLREALWMLLLRGETEEVQLHTAFYPLPDGITPQVTVRRDEDGLAGPSMWSNTAQTFLTWRWIPETGPVFAGDMTWPNSYDAADNHAAALLHVAEEGFVERCPPRHVSSMAMLASRPVQKLNDVDAEAISELDQDLRDATGRWKSLRPCRSGRE
jgi:hypothetical protein